MADTPHLLIVEVQALLLFNDVELELHSLYFGLGLTERQSKLQVITVFFLLKLTNLQ